MREKRKGILFGLWQFIKHLSPSAIWARLGLERFLSAKAALLWLFSLIWLGIIFFLGQQTSTESAKVSLEFTKYLRMLLPFIRGTEAEIHLFVRKAAHFTSFMVLAVLVYTASRATFRREKRVFFFISAAMLLLGAANEIEQMFVPGRGPAVKDVLIDFSGALTGMLLMALFEKICKRMKGRKMKSSTEERMEAPIFDAHSKWLCAAEFASLSPVNVFHREHENVEKDARNETLGNFHMYARRVFRMGASAKSAEVLVTADDYYKLYINGEYVAQGPAPGYPDHYYVNRIDVLKYLKAGDNVIALDVYYQGLINRVWVSGDLRQGFMCELRVDGRTVVRSDEHFHYMRSSSYENRETYGYETQWAEHFDSREEPDGWRNVGFDDFLWMSCVAKAKPDYHFYLQETPVLQTGRVAPVSAKREGRRVICDFGREISGVLILRAEGESGKIIIVHTGEELNDDGSVRWNTRCNCRYEDTWTLSGNCEWEMFDYRGFRYVQFEEEDGAKLISVSARTQHYPLDEDACRLETSDVALMDIFDLTKNTMRAGIQEAYLDCPTREKGQYSGDLAVTSLSHIYLSGDTRLLKKSLMDWMRSSFITESLMAVFPSALMQEIADYSLLFPLVALRCYEHTGDRELLEQAYHTAKNMLGVFEKYARPDGLLDGVTEAWNIVDWPQNLRDDYDFPLTKPVGSGCHNVINAFYLGAVRDTQKIASVLGEEYDRNWEALKQAYNKAFFREETGLYADSETSMHSAVHSNILPLFFEIVPEEKQAHVADWLVSSGIKTGVYMAFFYLKALAHAGRYEDVYRLLVADGEHSWRNMLNEGATTLFEAWGKDQKWNTSLCHPWASAPVSVLVEDILGITPEVAHGGVWKQHLPADVETLRMTVPVCDRIVSVVREKGNTVLTMEKREMP